MTEPGGELAGFFFIDSEHAPLWTEGVVRILNMGIVMDLVTFETATEKCATAMAARKLFETVAKTHGFDWFDAISIPVKSNKDKSPEHRFYVSNYFSGDAWAYLPKKWPEEDVAMAQLMHAARPRDYLQLLKSCKQTMPVIIQKGLLKSFRVRQSWLFPHNTVGAFRVVTVYRTAEAALDQPSLMSALPDLFLKSAIFLDRIETLLNGASDQPEPMAMGLDQLTDEEEQCLRLLAKGLGNKEIADNLSISVNTVRYHLKKVYKKLGVSTRSEAIRAALGHLSVNS